MARNTANPFGQPTLEDLMVRFLASRSDAAAAAVETGEGEVEPHEVAAGFRVDPRAAWTDATNEHHQPPRSHSRPTGPRWSTSRLPPSRCRWPPATSRSESAICNRS